MNPKKRIEQALTLHRQEKFAEAAAIYQQLLRQTPNDYGLLHLLGLVYYQQGLFSQAISLFEKTLAIHSRDPMVFFNFGKLLTDAGQIERACDNYRRAIAIAGAAQWSAPHANLANNLLRLHRYHEAVDSGSLALRINPRDEIAHLAVASAHRHLGNLEAAHNHLTSAYQINKRFSILLQDALLIPPMIDSVTQIKTVREKLIQDLDRISATMGSVDNPVNDVGMTYFYLSYHGLLNLDINQKLAATHIKACPQLVSQAAHCKRYRGPKKKIRIGFISAFLYLHSIGKTTRGIMAHLDKNQFEVVALFIPPVVKDEVSDFIRNHAQESVELPINLWAARDAIAHLELDILFYQDIGMEPFSYFLAFSRLAPVQCVSFGHPDTTGIPNMDWFVSSALYETHDADAHYSERLFKLENCGTLAYYYKPERPNRPMTRAELGLPDSKTIYLCPQTLFKLHPDIDGILAGILKGDPNGCLVLLQGNVPEWVGRLFKRLGQIDSSILDRVLVLPVLPPDQFTALVAAADVMLDTIYFNGMNTSLEAFAMGTPVVTMPTALQRGRHTAGMYAAMGIKDAIATTPQEYIDIAVGLGTDPGRRKNLSERIVRSHGCLFENKSVVTEFERFFKAALAALHE